MISKFNKLLLLFLMFSPVVNGRNLRQVERMKRGSRISCKASLTTVMISAGCPSDPYAIEQRKRTLSCETVHQNCTEPANFRYHCVLNEYANQSVEVCAVATKIIGNVCAEFNEGGKFVQEHYATLVPCSRCPFMYVSSDAYQYQECYENIKNISSTLSSSTESVVKSTHSTRSTSTISPSLNQEAGIFPWLLTGISLFVVIIATIILVIIQYKRLHRNRDQEQLPETVVFVNS